MQIAISPAELNSKVDISISPDVNDLGRPERLAVIDTLRATLVNPEWGRPYISITSTQALNEPIVSFRLNVTIDDVSLRRQYALTPTFVRTANTRRPARPAATPITTRSSTESKHAQSFSFDGQNYGPVASGESLWLIAKKVSAGSNTNVGQLVDAIYRENPQAFIGGDKNRLRVGANLTIPTFTSESVADTMPATSTSDASATMNQVDAPFEPLTTVDQLDAEQPLLSNVDEPAPAAADQLDVRTAVEWQATHPEIATELARLKERYAAIRARYEAQRSGHAATADPDPSAQPLQAEPQSPTVAATVPDNTDRVQNTSNTPADATPRSGAADQSTAGDEIVTETATIAAGTATPSTLLLATAVVCGLLALALAGYFGRKAWKWQRKKSELANHQALEESRKAEVTKKAQHRITMENEVQRMLQQRDQKTADEMDTTADSANVSDLNEQAAIDMSIAHGRYAEAEKLLGDVIKQSPNNYSAKLRLAEVYYITERVDDFVELADDLHKNHRPELADEDWRRIMRMGKIIAPDRPPFSGPRSVSADNQAS